MLTFADRLRALRAIVHWTQRQAAEQIGVSERTFEGWEKGKTPANPHLILEALERRLRLAKQIDRLRP